MHLSRNIPFRMRIALCTAWIVCLSCGLMWLGWHLTSQAMVDEVSQQLRYQPLISNATNAIPLVLTQAKDTSNVQMIFYGIGTILLSSTLGYILSGVCIRPLHHLTQTMSQTTTQKLPQKIQLPQTKDELSQAVIAFNDMVYHLEEAFAHERRFSANVAHELRTPLASMMTKYEVFSFTENHSQEEYQQLISFSIQSVQVLHQRVENLLTLYRQNQLLTPETINLSTLLLDIADLLEHKLQQQDVTLEIDCPDVYIAGDLPLLISAFQNVLDNAVSYNKPGGLIQVQIAQTTDAVEISVRDTGVGMVDTQHIFEPFSRCNTTNQTNHCGLGLALTQKIILLHHGTIRVDSTIGEGSCFWITLPKQTNTPVDKST